MRSLSKLVNTLMLCAAMASSAWAAELVGNAAFAGSSFGQQSDPGAGSAYSQNFSPPSGAVLEAVRWWGFHGAVSGGPGFDNFVVVLGGVVLTGTLTITSTSAFFDEYTLDIVDTVLSGTTLSIINDSLDVEWFWQSAPASGNPGAPSGDAVAFSLIGHLDVLAVPEPSSLALFVLGAGCLLRAAKARGRNDQP